MPGLELHHLYGRFFIYAHKVEVSPSFYLPYHAIYEKLESHKRKEKGLILKHVYGNLTT